jgi:Arsenical resistance operon protein ArsD
LEVGTVPKKLEVFDPPMRCSMSLCGVDVDSVLARIAADLTWVAAHGIDVRRYNLGYEPESFTANPAVVKEIEAGIDRLPIVAVDGQIISAGTYPSREQLAQELAIPLTAPETPN